MEYETCHFLASFVFVIIFHALTFMPFISFGTQFFRDRTLQLSVYFPKLIMNG